MSKLLRKTLVITIRDVCDDCDDDHLQPPKINHAFSPVKILMLCILALAFAFVCYITIIKTCRRTTRSRTRITSRSVVTRNESYETRHQDEDHEEHVVFHPVWLINTVGLDQSVIDSIEIIKYRTGDGTDGMDGKNSDCVVCLGVFEEEERLRRLPKCGHAFHVTCIDTWLRSHTNCPLCRAAIDQNAVEEEATQDQSIGVENGEEVDADGESLEKKCVISGVRVQSDLCDRCCERLEPTRRASSMGSFCFVDLESGELVVSRMPNEVQKRAGSSSRV